MLRYVCNICNITVILTTGQCLAHHCCAAWSEGVIQADDYSLLYVDKAVFNGLSQVNFYHVYNLDNLSCHIFQAEGYFLYSFLIRDNN